MLSKETVYMESEAQYRARWELRDSLPWDRWGH